MEKPLQKYLLKLARNTIAEKLGVESGNIVAPENAAILREKRGVFVTLEMEGALRGCIGNIIPVYDLEKGVCKNAINAAFEDPRFYPLTKEEFENVKIEISVLTVPEKLEYENASDLLEKLRPLKDGVILQKGGYEATYLPQVWADLSDKEKFLGTLCMKAGMNYDEWRKGDVKIMTYQAEVFGE
ncbi:MAG: AmmeMemoRadiSam system protein A [Candidatus Gracilibacteria bacterium]